MHEYSITSSIIDIIEKIVSEKKIKKVKRIDFELSPLAGIEPDSIKFYFGFLTENNNVLKGADLIFNKKTIKVICRSCNCEFEAGDLLSACPSCGESVYCSPDSAPSDDIRIVSLQIR